MLLAVMGLGVSCVNDGLSEDSSKTATGSMSSLEEQAAAMKQSVKDIRALEGDYSEAADAICRQISFIESGASMEEGALATLSLQKSLAAMLGVAEHTGDSALETVHAGISSWMGQELDQLYPLALAQAKINTVASSVEKQKTYAQALSSDIESGIKKDENPSELASLVNSVEENEEAAEKLSSELSNVISEVETAYQSAITRSSYDSGALKQINKAAAAQTKAVDDSYAGLVARVAVCEALIVQISERLGALEDEIEDLKELLGLIQSLSFVSEYSNDKAIAYYNLDLANRTYDDVAKRNPTSDFTLEYIVRPASAAAALTDATLWNNGLKVYAYYAQAITRAPILYNLKVEEVKVSSGTYGIISVKVKNAFDEAFYYKKTGAKVALSVATGKTDFTTDFVEVMPKDASSTVYVESLELPSDYIEIDDGQSKQLNLTIAPSNASNREIVWTTSNQDVVQVSGTGQIVAKGVGTAVITATSKSVNEWGNKISTSCTVKVNPAIRLSGPSYVEVGKSVDLMLDYPGSMQVESRVWTSSDNSKATVTSAGVVTGVGNTYNLATNDYGTVTISCTVNGLTTLSHEMKVVVTQPTAIKLKNYADNVSEITIKVDQSLDLGATIVPEVPADQFRLFYQSTSGLGWIDSSTGVVNANRNVAGVTYVYIDVMNYDKNHYFAPGRSLRRTVIVRIDPYYVTSIKLDDIDMQPNQTVTLSPKLSTDVAGKTPTNTAVTWTSSNTSVATVDQNGKVTSLTAGTTTITATATDGSNVSGSCKVTVTQPWKSFEVGDYVVRTTSGDIDFSADLNTAKSKGTIVGVVITKTNPRATDPMLPASCTHGIAIALGEGEGTWVSDNSQTISAWASQNGYAFVDGNDKYSGYTNTQALKAYINAKGCSSGMIAALKAYTSPSLPNNTSGYYLPSVQEAKDIAAISNSTFDFSNKLKGIGGTGFTNDNGYWTVSETGGSAYIVRTLIPNSVSTSPKTGSKKFRYVFAF